MVAQYSEQMMDALHGDNAALNYLAICEKAFLGGERQALFDALALCAKYQAVMPDWVADALLHAKEEFDTGNALDFNEIFGLDKGKLQRERQARAKETRIRNATGMVLDALAQRRLDGGSLNAEEMFGAVSETLSSQGTKVSRRDVEQIYRAHGQGLSKLPQKRDPAAIYASSHTKLPEHRRRGRPPF